MARYSPIGPIAVLQQLQNSGSLGNYLLLLAHDVIEHTEAYRNLVSHARALGPLFIIMDNSVVELGQAVHPHDLLAAAEVVEADCIVLPDVIGDFHATRDLIIRDLHWYAESKFPFMKVPQGQSHEDIFQCIDWMHQSLQINIIPQADYWAAPRWVANLLGSRSQVINYISRITGDNCNIHLLGMSQHIADDIACAYKPDVMGIDSANPLVFGQAGKRMDRDVWIHMDRGGYWDDTHIRSEAHTNIQYIRSQIGDF